MRDFKSDISMEELKTLVNCTFMSICLLRLGHRYLACSCRSVRALDDTPHTIMICGAGDVGAANRY